jgi:hypothetical protein
MAGESGHHHHHHHHHEEEARPKVGKWLSGFWDTCGEPGGCSRCMYAHCCWPCAAGTVAERTGGRYVQCVHAVKAVVEMCMRRFITALCVSNAVTAAIAFSLEF